MDVAEILCLVMAMPTIMTLNEELVVISQLMNLSEDEVLLNYEDFATILDRLHESHTGGGIFEVSRDNALSLQSFVTWLRNIASRTEINSNRAFLNSVAVDMSTPFS